MEPEKIIVFSDVHGNIYALEELFKRESADQFICLGDSVNYAPYSNECLEFLITKNVLCVRGNHEDIFMDKNKLNDCPPLVNKFYEQTYPAFNQNLLSYISQLPQEITINNYRFIHTLENKYIYPETSIEIKGKFFIGHSHVQYAKFQENNFIINPGSLGQNRNNLSIIQYAVLFTKTETVKFQSRYLSIEPLVRDMKSLGYADELINYYTKVRE